MPVDSAKAASLPDAGKRNAMWATIDFIVTPLGMLLAVPILLRNLGLEQFGILILANSLTAFSSVFNFGFGDTALKFVSHHMGRSDASSAARVAQTVGLLTVGSAVVVGLAFWTLSPTAARLLHIWHVPHAPDALHIVSVTMGLRMAESVYAAIIRGAYRYDLAAMITAGTKLLSTALQVVLAIQGLGIVALLLATAVTLVMSVVMLFAVSWRLLGDICPAFSRDEFAQMSGFSVWSWLQGLGGLVYANTDRLLITAMLGPSAVGIYGICAQLAQNIHYGFSAAAHTFFPTVSMLRAAELNGTETNPERLRTLYLKVSRLLSVCAVTAACTLAVFAREILDLWVGAEVADRGASVLALLSLSFGWFAANSIAAYYTLNGLGLAKIQAATSLVSALLLALSSIVLIPVFGLLGAASVRFPDSIFRMAIRMHIGTSIIGSIRRWIALDFLRITLVGLAVLYMVKLTLYHFSHSDNVLTTPAVVCVPLASLLCGICIFSLESRLARDRDPTERQPGNTERQ